jgi:bacterioferritin-associated ferredoxin
MIICTCNNLSSEVILNEIHSGASTLNEIKPMRMHNNKNKNCGICYCIINDLLRSNNGKRTTTNEY